MGICLFKQRDDCELTVEIKMNNPVTIKYENEYKEIIQINDNYYQDIKTQNNYIENCQSEINNINDRIATNKEKSNISVIKDNENNMKLIQLKKEILSKINEIIGSLKLITNKNSELKGLVNNFQNYEVTTIKCNLEDIQSLLNEMNKIYENNKNIKNIQDSQREIYKMYGNRIKNNILSIKNTHEYFDNEKKIYEKIKKNIDDEFTNIKNLEKVLTENIDKLNTEGRNLFGSMLMGVNIQLILTAKDTFDTSRLFNDEKNKIYNSSKPDLLRENWHEICEIYEDYDLHEINFEIKAIGLLKNQIYNVASVSFYNDPTTLIEILQFEIDGMQSNYTLDNFSLDFNINLENFQSNKIHFIYKESKKLNELKEEEIISRKFYRQNYYGLSQNLKGRTAKFILKLKCNFEIVSLEDEFFLKKEGKYEWGGEVPEGGKRTLVKLSKKEAKWSFNIKHHIKSIDGSNLENTHLTVPIFFDGGNNQIQNLNVMSNQTNNIEKNKKNYIVNFENTNSNIGEFIIKGTLINKCKSIWKCDFTTEEIENEIPEDIKKDKNELEKIARNIINNYNENNKNNLIIIPDIVKIGKWVHKNIKFDNSYSGNKNITAMEIYSVKKGVCEQFTKLFNGLLYSLGYQVIKVTGYAVEKSNIFSNNCSHVWSLIKIYDDWLPFDATWGIFTGKLPVCHIFSNYFTNKKSTRGVDTVTIEKSEESGKFEE